MSTIDVVAIVKAKPGKVEEVIAAITPCVALSREEEANHAYTPHRDLDDPETIVFIERWASRDAFNAHLETEHFKTMADKLGDLLAQPIAIHLLKPI
ncbi:antibiotic biosynthesis monooxygenase [Acetobacter sacchari]|uniref:Antibiotic biosynthesis monooxygenase n=1 Tax=Acetobacter sacchari TaxID=2661687 RepID=A0ABS3LT31_9PROT|nr:putative quinol monooxygenase [Acetobacter sacchari]MBO1359062.1 antibiotic biosynthesis monooxygenase [Acetobacter sacchari]